MVKAAENLLFDKSMRDSSVLNSINRPLLVRAIPEEMPPEDLVLVQSFAELLFEDYRNGGCLHCSDLLREEKREDEGKLVLRALLGVFDQEGEPIPRELRAWSAAFRFVNPPRRSEGRADPELVARQAHHLHRRDSRLLDRHGTNPRARISVHVDFRRRGACISGERNPQLFVRGGQNGVGEDPEKEKSDALGPAMLKRWREQDRVSPIVARIRAILRRRREQARTLN